MNDEELQTIREALKSVVDLDIFGSDPSLFPFFLVTLQSKCQNALELFK